MTIKKLVVLSSGGDAPGMNAAIRAVVRSAIYHDIDVFGTEHGYAGLVKNQLFPLSLRSVANCIQRGGTILKTGRLPAFRDKALRDQCRQFLRQKQIDGLIVLGGNGSFVGASLLAQEGGPNVIGIPCTIDNDINGSEYCIGFDTARNTALAAIDKIRDTAFSLDRNFIIEVMGRSSGFLAVDVGIAGGAEFIIIPEFPFSMERLATRISQQQHGKKLASIIVVAEADRPNHSIELAKDILEKTGVLYKVCILGHTQRGGTPSAQDRVMGSLMGASAVDLLRAGQTQHMVAIDQGQIIAKPFPDPEHATRFFDDQSLLKMNDVLCEI